MKYQVQVIEYDDDKAKELGKSGSYVQPERVLLTALVDDIPGVQRLVNALTEGK